MKTTALLLKKFFQMKEIKKIPGIKLITPFLGRTVQIMFLRNGNLPETPFYTKLDIAKDLISLLYLKGNKSFRISGISQVEQNLSNPGSVLLKCSSGLWVIHPDKRVSSA